MTPQEYLDAAKGRMGITSDYALAQRFEIPRQDVARYRKGRCPDNYTATKIAITLELDPAQVIADLEAQREKDPRRLDFWRSFLARAAVVATLACTLASNYSDGLGFGVNSNGGNDLAIISAVIVAYLWASRRRIMCIM